MEFITDFVMAHEKALRMGFFVGMLALMGLWEVLAPRRALSVSKPLRWGSNLAIVFFNNLVVRLVFPTAAVGIAVFCKGQHWGVFNYVELPIWFAVVATIVAMDLVIYLQHVMVHAVPLFWRLHRVHHADLDFDVTTGARFHPIEILLSMLIKFATIIVLGAPVLAVVVFEIVLNAMAMFNHANVRLPLTLDRVLRLLVVTPDMHRVHHSVHDDEANSNFGFNMSLWDRLFGTYRAQPRDGHDGMTIGIRKYREPRQVAWLDGMLWLPFRGKITDYAINRRQWGDGNAD